MSATRDNIPGWGQVKMLEIHGNIVAYVMPIMWKIIRSIVVAAMLFGACESSMAASTLAPSIDLGGHRIISKNSRELDITNSHGPSIKVRVPSKFGKALSASSVIIFPEPSSLVIDGREFVLVIVGQPSSSRAMGYCGAGIESTLYALLIQGESASIAFEKLVQSCLKNVDLASDGVAPAYRSVSWNAHPTGIRVRWMNDENGNEATRVYQYHRGRFVESPVSPVD